MTMKKPKTWVFIIEKSKKRLAIVKAGFSAKADARKSAEIQRKASFSEYDLVEEIEATEP